MGMPLWTQQEQDVRVLATLVSKGKLVISAMIRIVGIPNVAKCARARPIAAVTVSLMVLNGTTSSASNWIVARAVVMRSTRETAVTFAWTSNTRILLALKRQTLRLQRHCHHAREIRLHGMLDSAVASRMDQTRATTASATRMKWTVCLLKMSALHVGPVRTRRKFRRLLQ
jgi:hypothetical protein